MSARATWCKHYHGLANGPTCWAGVNYDDVRVEVDLGGGKVRRSLPCVPEFQLEPCSCFGHELRTAEEIAAEKAVQEKRFADIGVARAAIVEHLGGPWNKKTRLGGTGRIKCPVCSADGETLTFSRAGYNGHIHARCLTPKCVSWME